MRKSSLALNTLVQPRHRNPSGPPATSDYSRFQDLDGTHPWAEAIPEACVFYQVRQLNTGKIDYFNFALAKEMGLIATEHPENMNVNLQTTLLETFSLRVINEYDVENKVSYLKESIKPKPYMATRYLQMQHPGKKGETSGDGRSIWNGTTRYRGKTWDVSSRGTGVTKLAPGIIEAGRSLKTGSTDFGYGCGLAELDELYAEAIYAESMHLQGHNTERVLSVINLGHGYGIGVRAGLNLIRPAHLLRLYRQKKWTELERAIQYHQQRQRENGRLPDGPSSTENRFERQFARQLANFAAILESDYIFMWLEWDGDNILLEPGIIDYGSIRQFGACHNEYRYDDVDRWSTSLDEQKSKAKHLAVDMHRIAAKFKKTKVTPRHVRAWKVQFEKDFKKQKMQRWFYQMGYASPARGHLASIPKKAQEIFRHFEILERAKLSKKFVRVPDGINQPALFNMRKFNILMIEYYATHNLQGLPEAEKLFPQLLTRPAQQKDLKRFPQYRRALRQLIKGYRDLLLYLSRAERLSEKEWGSLVSQIKWNANKINSPSRLTGNAVIQIVNVLIDSRKKGLSPEGLQNILQHIIALNSSNPEVPPSPYLDRRPRIISKPKIYSKILSIIHACSEDI